MLGSASASAAEIALKIHRMKRWAYAAVLRSFCAQSDVLSGAKEECLAKLRKELRILETEHGEYLVEARSNKQTKSISVAMIKGSTCNNEVMKDTPYLGSTEPDGVTVFQIHCLERSAYASVIRAFGAVTNQLSWLQVKLLAQLRNELRLSYIEHKEVLAKVISDEHINSLRKFSQENYSVVMKMDAAFHAQAVVPDKITSTEQLSTSSISCLSLAQKSPIPEQPMPSIRQEPRKRKTEVPVMRGSKNQCAYGRTEIYCKKHRNKDLNVEHTYEIFKIRLTADLLNKVEKLFKQNLDPANLNIAKSLLKAQEKDLLDALAKLSEVSNDEDNDQLAEVINHDETPPRPLSSTDKTPPETTTNSPSADSDVILQVPPQMETLTHAAMSPKSVLAVAVLTPSTRDSRSGLVSSSALNSASLGGEDGPQEETVVQPRRGARAKRPVARLNL